MNSKHLQTVFEILAALTWHVAIAQQPEVQYPDSVEPPPPAFFEPPPRTPPPDSPVFQWMKRLRERDPERCARLERLQQENPEMFHFRVRQLLEKERIRLTLQNYPSIRQAVEALSPEEQEAFYEQMAGRHAPSPRRLLKESDLPLSHRPDFESSGPMRERRRSPPEGRLVEEWPRLAELRERYASAKSKEEKETIKEETRRVIERWLDRRAAVHEQRLRQLEMELARLKEVFQQMLDRKEQSCERLLNRILGSTNKVTASDSKRGHMPDPPAQGTP